VVSLWILVTFVFQNTGADSSKSPGQEHAESDRWVCRSITQ